jgi:hypothetical protein
VAVKKLPTVILRAGEDRRVRGGHPWAFSNEILMDADAKAIPAGSLATLRAPGGEALGVCTFNPHSLIAARLLSTNPEAQADALFFGRILTRAAALRDRLVGVPYYRLIHAEAERRIRLECIKARRLQTIRHDLVRESVSATFLIEIEQDAATVLGHPANRPAQLIAAIAFEASEQIARQTGGMDPNGDGSLRIRLPDHDRNLIAQALTAPEHHEFRLRRTLERHGRAADDGEIGGCRRPETLNGFRTHDGERLTRDMACGERNDHQGRQDQCKRSEFKPRAVENARRADGGIRARANPMAQQPYPVKIDDRQSESARRLAIKAKMLQPGGRHHEPRLT